ncbi:pentapeptide repeat-containing protein [Sporosarcina thermotolerans]|uniref:Pentapeptide repeat-containing protein n=1 Tax=Sporosarcina thermotolerans TaxID=633404 RepID=A0AAW9A8C6_9BACL|nr:pentapeptide repeat-containing protein [Sporosarcina thermotolerans]MDW0117442.1 pentapeptide repeat-containing protein [Sporosarcina thermotolerans]WHT49619.1 pentapeptide repeat-containing protein [Sporosarcina thermotolerans]
MLNVKNFDLKKADISGSKWQEVKAEKLEIDNVSLANTKINNVNMSKMAINDVNLGDSKISNANLSGVGIQHANFSNAFIDHVHLFGTEFHNIVFPVEGEGNFNPDGQYKPISFLNSDLTKGQFKNCNLSHMEIIDCDITGLKINGILIEELIKNK